MNLESVFAQLVQTLLWPVLLVALAFVYAFGAFGSTLTPAWQRWRQPQYRALHLAPGQSREDLEWQLQRQLQALRLLSRLAPMLALIATMIPLGPALQSLAAGHGREALVR